MRSKEKTTIEIDGGFCTIQDVTTRLSAIDVVTLNLGKVYTRGDSEMVIYCRSRNCQTVNMPEDKLKSVHKKLLAALKEQNNS